MCRFLFYIGSPVVLSDLITEPSNSLIHQSYHSEEREEPLNGDGFGVAWYVPEVSEAPGVFRSISPAWSNRNLLHLARVTRSGCMLAHVRAASEAHTVTENNTHPFVSGPFTFMHNGDVAGFHENRRALMNKLSDPAYSIVHGTTDSEYSFAYFLDRWHAVHTITDASERMATAMVNTIRDLTAFSAEHSHDKSYLNMVISDGQHAVISRYTTDLPENAESLHLHTGKYYHCVDGVCRLLDPPDGHGAVIVSSEKLSEDPGWQTIPANHIVVVRNDRTVEVRPV